MLTAKPQQKIPYDYEISRRFTTIPILYLITIVLAVIAYGEPFRFWEHAFSDLGMTFTKHGYPNKVSLTLHAAGMIVCAFQMAKIAVRFFQGDGISFHKVKSSLAWIGVFGFLVSITPNNLQHSIHSVGIGCVIGSLFLLTNLFLFENRDWFALLFFSLILTFLFFTVLAYAYAFFVNSVYKQVFQKLCVFGLMFSIILSVRPGEYGFKPRDFFRWPKVGNRIR